VDDHDTLLAVGGLSVTFPTPEGDVLAVRDVTGPVVVRDPLIL
jgi:hypothetical protein